MTEASSDFLGHHLFIEGSFPLEWRVISQSESGSHGISNLKNEKILRQVIDLDEFTTDHKEELFSTKENIRLEKKLNLIIDLLGALVDTYRKTPVIKPLRVYSQGLEWHESGATLPAEGEQLEVSLYLHSYSPSPVVFTGKFQGTQHDSTGVRCRMMFDEMTDSVQDLLEKLIFQHHRRSIASRKSGSD